MQYGSVDLIGSAERHGWPRGLRHLPAALTAFLAVYGLGTHHVVLVIAGLAAALAFQHRLADARKAQASRPLEARHADGGSFPGRTPTGTPTPSSPRLIDGGIERADGRTPWPAGPSGVQ